ncbi:MAG: FHA domain-containing protein [Anaerolineae bacterium]|nr:FHA domain-containing protein [Anaerolineae bacterium]
MSNNPLDEHSVDILLFLLRTQSAADRSRVKIRECCQLSQKQADERIRRLTELGLITKATDYYNLTASGKTRAKELDQAQKTTGGDKTNITLTGSVIDSNVTITGISDASMPTTGKLEMPATARKPQLDPLATPLDYSDLTGMKTTSPVFAETNDQSTLDASESPVPSYTIHPLRFTDTSFLQNERLKKEPDVTVRFVLTFEEFPAALPLPVVDRDSMGRSRKNDIWLRHDLWVSGEQCRFHIKQTRGSYELYVEDLNSKNGTIVDGKRIAPRKQVPLRHGTRLKVGQHTAMIITQIAEPLPLLSEAMKKIASSAPQTINGKPSAAI